MKHYAAILCSSALLIVSAMAQAPQLTLEAKFVEFDDPLNALDVRKLALGGGEAGTNGFRGILTPANYRALMKHLEGKEGVDILSTPKITTQSGRQAQIKTVDIRYIATKLDFSGAPTNRPQTIAEPFELGPVLDVIPSVRPDGVSIEMKLISTIREFIGYDLSPRQFDPGPPKPLTPAPIRDYLRAPDGAAVKLPADPVDSIMPLPTFRLRQAETNLRVWDGQTAAFALEVKTPVSTNANLKYASSGKTCFVFVTPTLIDATGDPVHRESDLPFLQNSAPR